MAHLHNAGFLVRYSDLDAKWVKFPVDPINRGGVATCSYSPVVGDAKRVAASRFLVERFITSSS